VLECIVMERFMATIVYFHGWASIGDSEKSRSLQSTFKHHTVIVPDLPIDPIEVENLIDKSVRNCEKPLIFVGTSLGGFYANYFAHKYNVSCFLINPSTIPSKSIANRIGLHKKYATGEEFEFKAEYLIGYNKFENSIKSLYNPELINLFLAKDDKVIDYNITLGNITDCKVRIMDDGGHRFEKHWNLVISDIKEYLNEI
jgi:predicted esterase YcpF (UPF0227 family)